jgi:serine-type D-Ala-D-Ala carboxypeptidase/endopeptidase (penicillin-binding protein 4)
MINAQYSMRNMKMQTAIISIASFLFFTSCSLEKKIARSATATVLNAPALATAHVGISIYEPATGKRWYDFQGDKYFVPASNTKIPTCYAAMKYLGDSLIGLMYGTGDEPGKIYIRGTGDPTLLHPDFKNQPVYDFLKKQNQPIIITNPNFLTSSLGSGWAWNDYNENYMAERSALPVYGNVSRWRLVKKPNNMIDFAVSPGVLRDSLRFVTPDFAEASTSDTIKRSDIHLDIRRRKDANVYELVVANSAFSTAEIPMETTNPATLAVILRDTLRLSVAFKTKYGIYNRSVIRSQPTDSMLKLMMHRSDNFFAEQSLLMVSNALLGVMSDRMVIDTLLKTDLNDLPQKPRWADGSGLSRYNLFTPRDFVAILQKMKNEFGMERIKIIFPTGGEGTISSYYKTESGYLYAKTGTLSGVVALSGYLVTKKNRELVFSVLVNNHQASATDVRRAVEKFLQSIRNKY